MVSLGVVGVRQRGARWLSCAGSALLSVAACSSAPTAPAGGMGTSADTDSVVGAGDQDATAAGSDASAAPDGGTAGPVQVDFLWVIDNSPSMCQEQRALAKAIQGFLSELQAEGEIDAQMAVVTVQQAQDKTDIKVVGRFRHEPATAFPPNCMERVKMHCGDDAQCNGAHTYLFATTLDSTLCAENPKKVTNPYTSGEWRCRKPDSSVLAANSNCSLNTTCEAACTDTKNHTDCRAMFEPDVPPADQRVRCVVPGGGTDVSTAGCLFPPATEGCPPPAQLPPVLKKDQLDLFRCIATVGAAQTQESTFEGAFRSAWTALDPKGPNCDYDACVAHLRSCCVDDGASCSAAVLNDPKVSDNDKLEKCWCFADRSAPKCEQERATWCEPLKDAANCQRAQLLRESAYLVVVFISDDDDCSMPMHLNPLDKSAITKAQWATCQRSGDAKGGNLALNEGSCELSRNKDANVYCPSDCRVGSASKDAEGKAKCGGGCADGGQEQAACEAEVAKTAVTYQKVAQHIGSVDEWVSRLKSLKSDPKRVIVAAVTGDATGAAAAQQVHRDRVNYYNAALRDVGPGQAPYICAWPGGEAGYGSRYVDLVAAFGEQGIATNICGGQDLTPAMAAIAKHLRTVW